jgi:hypothetical protein
MMKVYGFTGILGISFCELWIAGPLYRLLLAGTFELNSKT